MRRAALAVLFTVAAAAAALLYPALARAEAWPAADWQNPWLLLGLLLVPLVFWRGTYGEDARVPRLRVGLLSPLAAGPRGVRSWFRDLPGVLRAVAVALFVLALARPVSLLRDQGANETGIDIVLVLDLSGSMRAILDAPAPKTAGGAPRAARQKRPTRLDTAKGVVRDFISRRRSDRIGVVVFGKAAYIVAPPTLDYHLLDSLVARMELDLIDGSGTAIGDALGTAVARMRRSDAISKAIILLTDGDNNAGAISPDYAAHLATVVGAKVYTIQIGNGDEVEVEDGVDLFGQPRYVVQRYPVNPELLQRIATRTGGAGYVATDAQALTDSMHDVLDRLEKTRFEARVASFEDLFPFLVVPGVALVALDALLRAWLLRRFP